MIRTSKALIFIVALCINLSWTASSHAQSHGIVQNRFLSPEKSTKSMPPQDLGIAYESAKLKNKAAAGLENQGQGKSLALRNGFGLKSSQIGSGQLQPLKNKEDTNRHVGEENWKTAFDGIKVKSGGPSKGKLPTGELLQSSSSIKHHYTQKTTHGLSGDGWSQLKKNIEGLK